MNTNDCVAMVLAGGRGERLGALTHYYSKPAVHFGGNSRIIDFTLNNCRYSGINTVGILSQYLSEDLNSYVSTTYNKNRKCGRMFMLPPRENSQYIATADAVYKNIEFIDWFQPENVLILAGDHIYRMDYNELIAFHCETGADVTVASTRVPLQDASRFGILNAYAGGRVYGFEEKPQFPKSCLASMGIYVFKWDILKKYLLCDSENIHSQHDFGKNIIPSMLSANESIFTYQFDGYWRDVGTLDSLWEANMDQISAPPGFLIDEETDSTRTPLYFLSAEAQVEQSIISESCSIFGKVKNSVLASTITVAKGAEIVNSVVMPGAYIGENAKVYKSIIGTGARILENARIGTDDGLDDFVDYNLCRRDVSLIAPWVVIPTETRLQKNSHVYSERLQNWNDTLNTETIPEHLLWHPVASKSFVD